VPAAGSTAAIRRELDSGQFGSAQTNFNEMRAPVALHGLVGCSEHPVVLLYGLLRQPAVAAVLASPARARPLVRVPIPADL
jgi:hypothetical protein